MRIRTIKPDFFRHEGLAELPFEARLGFQGLWCLADAEGRLEDRPKRIKADIFPYDDLEIEPILNSLHLAGFIVRYQVEGKGYIQIPSWAKHQRLSGKEAQTHSQFPPPAPEKQRGSNGEATGKINEREESQERSMGKERNTPNGDGDAPSDLNFWDVGESVLVASGMSKRNSRTFLGAQIKKCGGGPEGEEIVAEAVAKAALKRPADPSGWIAKTCDEVKKKRDGPPKVGIIAADCPDCDKDGRREVMKGEERGYIKCTHGGLKNGNNTRPNARKAVTEQRRE